MSGVNFDNCTYPGGATYRLGQLTAACNKLSITAYTNEVAIQWRKVNFDDCKLTYQAWATCKLGQLTTVYNELSSTVVR